MSERNKSLTRRFYDEVLNKKKLEVVDELCAPGIIDHGALPGQRPGAQGVKEALTQWLRAFPDLKVNIHEVIAEGNVVATRLTGEGIHKGTFLGAAPTGKKVTFHAIEMIRVEDGKAAEVWHEGNDAEVMMQLGVHLSPAK
jgi:predicted ester cyclase